MVHASLSPEHRDLMHSLIQSVIHVDAQQYDYTVEEYRMLGTDMYSFFLEVYVGEDEEVECHPLITRPNLSADDAESIKRELQAIVNECIANREQPAQ
jgi:hypothetical protein